MCSPQVMAKVQDTLSRRRLLGRAATTGAALAVAAGAPAVAARQGEAGTPPAVIGATPANATPASATPVRALASPVAAGGFGRVQDLSHVITPAFPVFPGFQPLQVIPRFTVEDDGFFANEVIFAEHTGTHLDAPAHFAAGGATAEQIPPERFIAPLAVIDISDRAASDPEAQLLPDDVLAWEERHGPLPAGAFVAMYSGWEARLADPVTYLNADADGVLHFPGIHPDAAALLIEERDVVGAGVDTLSLDYGASQDFASHLIILPAGKYGLENLAGLADVPPSGATIVVGAPKHVNASGGPTRAFALF